MAVASGGAYVSHLHLTRTLQTVNHSSTSSLNQRPVALPDTQVFAEDNLCYYTTSTA